YKVTGVQTCALPISRRGKLPHGRLGRRLRLLPCGRHRIHLASHTSQAVSWIVVGACRSLSSSIAVGGLVPRPSPTARGVCPILALPVVRSSFLSGTWQD